MGDSLEEGAAVGWDHPVPVLNKKRVAARVADLEAESFDVRKRANEELEKLVELAEPAILARLAANPPLEVKQRLDKLLERLRGPVTLPEQARALRGVEILERIGTPAAREVLTIVAGGTPESRITQAAVGSPEPFDQADVLWYLPDRTLASADEKLAHSGSCRLNPT